MRQWLAFAASSLGAGCAGAPQPSANVVPFDPHSNQVAIAATANGVPLRFLVDTAVDPSAIDRAAAAAAGLKKLGEDEAVDGVGNDAATAYPSVITTLGIGGRTHKTVDVVVNDMSKLRARYGAPLDGILGYSLLKDRAALFDYPQNRITFYDGGPAPAPRGCRQVHEFDIRFRSEDEKTILVPGLAIGGVEVPAFLDTGSSNGLRMDLDSAAVAPIRHLLPEGEAGTSVGARGEAPVRRAILAVPVTLGPFRADQVDASMVREGSRDREVNIGNRFLRAIGAKLLVDIPAMKAGVYGSCPDRASAR